MNRIISYFRVTFFFIVALSSVSTQAAEKQVEKEMVIAQMNSCVNTLTNIINNKSMTVLEHETDQLLNNLTIEQIVGLYEIADFREELIDAIGKLGITEEERSLLKRINSIKQDNLKWQAFSSALSNTMMITGGGNISLQAGFQALVTVARTAVEFKVAENEQQIEDLQAMWELRKSDLNEFITLRKQALSIIFSLYQKYNLKESDRLTEQTSQLFQNIISDYDPQRMVRLLDDNFNKFGHIADYYYYLGMGYIDMNNIPKAMSAFANYERLYSQAPIYRINEKSGLISLVKLAYLTNLSNAEIEKELNNALINLPNNTMAYIQCATVYDKVLNNPNKALSILRSALDNMMISDKAAIITAASTILPKLSNQGKEYKDFMNAYNSQQSIDMNAALNMCIATEYDIFDFLSENIEFSNLYQRVLFIGPKKFGDKITLTHSKVYSLELSNVDMFIEQHKDDEITVSKYIIQDKTAVSLEEIEKIDAFKSNPNLKYLYMWSCGENLFQIKDNLDYNAITNENFPRQSEFTLNEKDIKKIVKFLKKHHKKSVKTELIAKKYITATEKKKEIGINVAVAYLSAGPGLIGYHTVKYIANKPDATFVKFVFNNDIRNIIVCYQWDKENNRLEPYCTEYQGETYFAGVSNENLTLEEETETDNKKSWWHRLWSSDDKKVKAKPQKSEDSKKKSWWHRLWNSENDAEKDENTAEQKKEQPESDANKEKSWWNIFRRSDKAEDVEKE